MNSQLYMLDRRTLTFFSGLLKKASVLRKVFKICAEIAVLPTLVLAWFQLSDIAHANTATAEKYISEYEKVYLPKWDKLNKLSNDIFDALEKTPLQTGKIDKEEQITLFDNVVKESIKSARPEVKLEVDLMAYHFRSALFCVNDGSRCDEERLIDYFEPHICHFVQSFYGYIDYMYQENRWDPKRGDLRVFNDKYDCKNVVGEEADNKKVADERVTNTTIIRAT